MASNETQNFHLNQWSLSDDVRMEDFNADNLTLENALSGMLQYAAGSYVGTGEYGSEHPNTLTFDFAPQVILIFTQESNNWQQMIAMRGTTLAAMTFNGSNGAVRYSTSTLSWGASSLSWYSNYADFQLNTAGVTHRYVALGLPAAQP